MKIASPISLPPITDAVVIRDFYDRSLEEAQITVQLRNENGLPVAVQTVTLRPSREVTFDGEQEVRETVAGVSKVVDRRAVKKTATEGGICTRIVANPEATDYSNATKLEQFVSPNAFTNYLVAKKAKDDVVAIEAAGVADGWLFPAAAEPDET